MSSTTWTRGALTSSGRRIKQTAWRAVEAQHRVSTMKLTDTLAEQDVLEGLIEETKPAITAECAHLDFLLFTPFRYSISNPRGSRFRRPYAGQGVFYCAEHARTALAETAFYRLLFYAESPATPWPVNPAEFTAFAVAFASSRSIDITAGKLASDPGIYHLSDYTVSQAFADDAREEGLNIIKYRSVRDPSGGDNFALLSCAVFASNAPIARQSWRLHLDANGARAICEAPQFALSFDRNAFAADPRMDGFAWMR